MARKTTGKKSSNPKNARVAHKPRGLRDSAASANRTAKKPPAAAKPSKPVPLVPVKKPRVGLTIKPRMSKPIDRPKANDASAAGPKGGSPAGGSATGGSSTPGNKILGGRGKRTRTVAEAASNISADSKGYVFINGRRVRMISTKGALPAKKPRNNGAAATAPVAEQPSIRSIKTKLSRKELNHYRDLLLHKRRELVGDLHAMETEALRSGGGNLSHMPIHMADIGTDTYDQDFMLGLAAAERDQLREIDGALQRIEDRSFGICQMTGKPIPKARLDAKPWAKHTIEAARKLEGQWGR